MQLHRLLDARPGGDSLGYFALRQDKHVVFSPSGKAAVSYRVVAGVAMASGDPLGDPEAWPGALTAYRELVARHGWTPAVLGCSMRGGTAWQRAGLSVFELGDEAVLDVAAFTLSGRAMRGVRQAVSRVERAGYTTRVRRVADLSPGEIEQIREACERWRDGAVERGFSMALGRLGEPGDEECVVVEAHADGRLRALLHFVPWGRDGLSLDLMRRAADCPNGVNEQLVVAALLAAPDLGVRHVSLNFAVFRSALERGSRLGAGPVLRLWRATLLLASRYWQIDSLYRFNDKFGPRWEPRYLCFRKPSDLPRVMVAALQAEAFLPSFGAARP
jgi:lysyl-tRNA synthetase class 2